MLDLTSFQKAIDNLKRAIQRSLANPSDEEVRDAVIQRFEYTFELAWKSLKRHLEAEGFPESATLTKKDLFREGAVRGLIQDTGAWFSHQIARNETSHTYNPTKAAEVHRDAVLFLKDAEFLFGRLLEKGGSA